MQLHHGTHTLLWILLNFEKVQRRAARFAKSYFRRTTSITQLLTELDWSQLADRRRFARLSMFFKAVHGLVAIPTDKLLRPSRYTRQSGQDTFINLPCRIDTYKFSFLPRTITDWNALPESTHSKPSVDSFRRTLQQPPDCC